jgi:hypothetical protein
MSDFPDLPKRELWIESREGGLFFVNALFFFPYLMLLIPLLTRIFVRGVVGGFEEPSVIVDTFPTLAEYMVPRMGWMLALPLWLVRQNLRVEHRTGPRVALWGLFLLHTSALLWTVTGWFGLHSGVLPGGLPG